SKCLVGNVHLCPVGCEGVVHALKRHSFREIKDDAMPAIVICKEGRAELAVDGKLVDIPDAVERRLGASAAVSVPVVVCSISGGSDHPETEEELYGDRDAIGAARFEELGLRRGLDGAIAAEEIQQSSALGREKEQGHQKQVERE